jgi:benzoyl-CoA 2,3-dioxygenase component B
MNEVLRREYRDDSQRGVDRFNHVLEVAGIDFRLRLPSARFNRQQGIYAGHRFDPEANPVSETEWQARCGDWLPSAGDRAYVQSLMSRAVVEPGKVASWLAPPRSGIKGRPVDYEYVRSD